MPLRHTASAEPVVVTDCPTDGNAASQSPKINVCSESGCHFTTNIHKNLMVHLRLHREMAQKCVICGKIVMSRKGLREHIKFMHAPDAKRYKCKMCSRTYKRPGGLMEHARLKHKDSPMVDCYEYIVQRRPEVDLAKQVDLTPLADTVDAPLKQKCKRKAEKKPTNNNKCTECTHTFRSKLKMYDHRRREHQGLLRRVLTSAMLFDKRRPFACTMCPRRFLVKDALAKHTMRHTRESERRFKCGECSRGYIDAYLLRAHMRKCHPDCRTVEVLHTVPLPVRDKVILLSEPEMCGINNCKKVIRTVGARERHAVYFHSVHQCQQCEKSYMNRPHLRIHIRAKHEGTKFYCDQCEYVTNRKICLTMHRKLKHITATEFTCTDCGGYSTNNRQNFLGHLRSFHELIKMCPLCGEKMPTAFFQQHNRRLHEWKRVSKCLVTCGIDGCVMVVRRHRHGIHARNVHDMPMATYKEVARFALPFAEKKEQREE